MGWVMGAVHVGQIVSFWVRRLKVTATVVRINSTTVAVKHCSDGAKGYHVPPSQILASS